MDEIQMISALTALIAVLAATALVVVAYKKSDESLLIAALAIMLYMKLLDWDTLIVKMLKEVYAYATNVSL